jgi:hypothetical protein
MVEDVWRNRGVTVAGVFCRQPLSAIRQPPAPAPSRQPPFAIRRMDHLGINQCNTARGGSQAV